MKLKNLKNNLHGVVDLGVVLMIGIAFVSLMVISYIMYQVGSSLGATGDAANTIANISAGFDSAISLILIAITIFILAIAISALLLLRGGR
jgi:hypothetical protein